MSVIVGIDEAGRGAWAGPVVAALCRLDPNRPIAGLMDSKRLSERRREQLYAEIEAAALSVGIGFASSLEIDSLGILPATFLAMRRALESSGLSPDLAQVDGPLDPGLGCPTQTIVRGDSLIPAISAASIIAKVTRDRWMREQALAFPDYGFERHKGYGTTLHQRALAQQGICALHRRSFAPVSALLKRRGVA